MTQGVHASSGVSAGRAQVDAGLQYFGKVLALVEAADRAVASVLVAHMLPSQPPFMRALLKVSTVAGILPKPRSADSQVMRMARGLAPCDPLDRAGFAQPEALSGYLERRAARQRVVLFDVGGYFAPGLAAACSHFSGEVIGVVEDTENGQRRYEQCEKLPCPVYSVARSPLKDAEDRLVGESIVYSVEALLREVGRLLPGLSACVIGYGKVGAAVSQALRARHVRVTVAESDPVRLVHALSAGYPAVSDALMTLAGADLVVSATGSRALGSEELARLRTGAFVTSVTSADDELDLSCTAKFVREDVTPHITRFDTGHRRHFHLLNDGNAANFLHGSVLGPAIHLVQAELLAAYAQLITQPHSPGLHEVPPRVRTALAAAWVETFHPAPLPSSAC